MHDIYWSLAFSSFFVIVCPCMSLPVTRRVVSMVNILWYGYGLTPNSFIASKHAALTAKCSGQPIMQTTTSWKYSEYFSSRDFRLFEEVFQRFGLLEYVKCSKVHIIQVSVIFGVGTGVDAYFNTWAIFCSLFYSGFVNAINVMPRHFCRRKWVKKFRSRVGQQGRAKEDLIKWYP